MALLVLKSSSVTDGPLPAFVSSIFPFLVCVPYFLRRNANTKILVDFVGNQFGRPISHMSNGEHSCCFPFIKAEYVSIAAYSEKARVDARLGSRGARSELEGGRETDIIMEEREKAMLGIAKN